MSEDGFDLFEGDARHLTLQQWTALRKSILRRAHQERHQAIRQLVAGALGALWKGWQRIRIRQEARAALGSMTDRELRDIGLSRAGIEAAIQHRDPDGGILRREPAQAMRSGTKPNRQPANGGPCSAKGANHAESLLDRPRLCAR